jgi:hypothetical protein
MFYLNFHKIAFGLCLYHCKINMYPILKSIINCYNTFVYKKKHGMKKTTILMELMLIYMMHFNIHIDKVLHVKQFNKGN